METVTRNLLSFAVQRVAGELVEMQFLTQDLNDDGSATTTRKSELVRVGFYDLTQAQIERLEKGGVTVQDGAVCAVPALLQKIPDMIVRGMQSYKVVNYTYSENVTTMIVSKTTVGFA